MSRRDSVPTLARRTRACLAALAASCVGVLATAAPAFADFGIGSFDVSLTNQDGSTATQAGGHAYAMTTEIQFNRTTDNGLPEPDGNVKDVRVKLPPGLIGDPGAVPRCSRADFLDPGGRGCPDATAIGEVALSYSFLPPSISFHHPIYNMQPPPGMPAQFAFDVRLPQPFPVFIDVGVRSGGDYGVTAEVRNIPQAQPIVGTTLTFWGVPADSSHDPLRGSCLTQFGGSSGSCPAGVAVKPLLRLPTSCAGPLTTTLEADSWQDPGNFLTVGSVSHDGAVTPVGMSGCDRLDFSPSITVQPTSSAADSPSGLDVELSVPQNANPDGFAEADLEDAEVALPEGMAVDPSSADGLGACSPAQIGLDSARSPTCPASSKIGTVEIDTPLLDDPLRGAIYLAEQGNRGPAQGQNPFGSLLAMYLVAEGQGVVIKLPGKVEPDPRTGRVTASFDDNPQLPFSQLRLHFKGGSRAPLVTPRTCGNNTTNATLTPWSGNPPTTVTSSFAITSGPNGGPCPPSLVGRHFDPGFTAGLLNPVAGTSSPFVLRLTRPDGHQELHAMNVSTPEGLSAVLKGVPRCADAQAAGGTCPEASRVGTAVVGAGAGSHPFYVRGGEVFLGGPYRGAPLSLAIEVPAIAGPFDLGTVIVRAAVRVDPRTAALTVVTDPIPQILEGIPLRVRDVRVAIDRPGFMVSPTNCNPMSVEALVSGISGATSSESSRFQVGGCRALGFDPRLRFRVKGGRRQAKRNAHPELRARLEAQDGDANIDRVQVKLPKGTFLDQDNLSTICTRAQYASESCPESTKVGSAIAESPLLEDPLAGPVYLIASEHKLPDLVADLSGIIDIDLFGRIDSKKNRIRNTFEVVPDVPVSRFDLTIDGGRNSGLLVNSHNICNKAKYRRVNVRLDAQNGITERQQTKVRGGKCGKRKKHEGKGHRHHGGGGIGGAGQRGRGATDR